MSIAAAPAPAVQARARAPLVVSCAAALLALINYTVPALTLPLTAADLGAGPTGPAWILNGILLGLSALLLVAGVVADEYGRRRTYLAGMLLFALATVLTATAPTTAVFVAARMLHGEPSGHRHRKRQNGWPTGSKNTRTSSCGWYGAGVAPASTACRTAASRSSTWMSRCWVAIGAPGSAGQRGGFHRLSYSKLSVISPLPSGAAICAHPASGGSPGAGPSSVVTGRPSSRA